jgi:hypothetical protein
VTQTRSPLAVRTSPARRRPALRGEQVRPLGAQLALINRFDR